MPMKDLCNAYVAMALANLERGFTPYFLTIMFSPIHGSASSVHDKMMGETIWLYSQLLTRMHRHPDRMSIVDMPLWIVMPDYPVPKSQKKPLVDVAINDGRHLHAAVMTPPRTRLDMPFNLYLTQHADRYSGAGRLMSRIDVRRVYETPEIAFGYAFKAMQRGRVGSDDVMLLPRAHSELPSRSQ